MNIKLIKRTCLIVFVFVILFSIVLYQSIPACELLGGEERFYNSVEYHCSNGRYFTTRWQKRLKTEIMSPLFPAFYDEKMYYADDGKIFIADLITGEILNILDDQEYLDGITTITNNLLMVHSKVDDKTQLMRAIDINTLQTEWTFEYPLLDLRLTPFGSKSFVLVLYRVGGELVCLDALTGEKRWTRKDIHNLAVFDDTVILVFDDYIRCYKNDNLELIWEIKTDDFDYSIRNAVLIEDRYYVLSAESIIEEGRFLTSSYLYSVDVKSGDILWQTEKHESFSSRGPDIVADKLSIYLYYDNKIYKYDKSDGKIIWNYSSTDVVDFQNLISTERVLHLIDVDKIYTISTFDAKPICTSKSELNLCCGRFYISNRHVLFCSDFGNLICFDGTAKARYQIDKNGYSVNGNNYDSDTSPLIMNDRTLLSARYVVEPFGGDIEWDPIEKKVTCKLLKPSELTDDLTDMNVVELWINKPTAKINGIEVQIDPDNPDVVPTIINDRTMVPMRFLAESLGCEVEWMPETKEIILTYTP